MSNLYQKPGIEITQVRKSQTPILTTPELEGCIVGNAYHWQDISLDSSIANTKYSNSALTISISGINSVYNDVKGDEQLVIIDLLGTTGAYTGVTTHLTYGTQFSVNTTVSGNHTVTISGTIFGSDTGTHQVKLGFRAKKLLNEPLSLVSSSSDIEATVGPAVSWNPLGFGTMLAVNNSSRSVNILAVPVSASMTTYIEDYLSLRDIYVFAPMKMMTDSDMGTLKTHCTTWSLPENKRERHVFACKEVTWSKNKYSLTSAEKRTIAEGIRDANGAYQERRLVSIHPDVAYLLETRHVSTVKIGWIEKSFSTTVLNGYAVYGTYAKLATDIILNNKTYKANTDITDTVWAELVAAGWGGSDGMVTVYVPVPGYYFGAQAVGMVIAKSPSTGLTNFPTSGLSRTVGSQDIFSEKDLNTMASGGTYIITQDTLNGPLYCRHHVTTDNTSVSNRELNVLHELDYTAKFLRLSLKMYVGKYEITPEFLTLIETVISGCGTYLKSSILNDFTLNSVVQDSIAPDTVRVEVTVKPRYSANYFKITLIY